MKFGVVIFPGSNCDYDIIHVLRNVMHQETLELWHKNPLPKDFKPNDWVILPGGFSYGDYLRAGAIARFSPVMKDIIAFAHKGGHVWGICNGFQILCESGLLPGALVRNQNQQFICKNINLKATSLESDLTNGIPKDKIIKIPIAHAEGRYIAGKEVIEQLFDKHQVLFQYCNENGDINQEANPNGSMHNIAGICNETRNVFGMMPHPERASEEELGNSDGRLLLDSLLHSAMA